VDDFDELLSRAAGWIFVSVGIDEVIPDVVLEHHGEQPIHRSPTTCYPLQDIGTAVLFVERTLDRFNLALDAANPVEKLLFFLNRVAHVVFLYTRGEYSSFINST
jgi:hypothetical protein